MKHLRFLLAAAVLALTLSVPAFAGDIWCGITAQPPGQSTASATGDMSAGVASTGDTATVDPVAETALQFMLSVLSLF